MTDIDALIRGLRSAGLPPAAPVLPWWTLRRVSGGLLVGAAAVALGVLAPGDWPGMQRVSERGKAATVAWEGELRMLVDRQGQAMRLGDGSWVHLDEPVYFRMCVVPAATLTLSVDGPRGRELLTEQAAPSGCVDARLEGALLAYTFDRPGPHRFVLLDENTRELDALTLEVR